MDISSINNQNLVNLNINVGGTSGGATQVSSSMISEQKVLNGFSSEDTISNLGGTSGASSSNGITVIENKTIINVSVEARESLGAASSSVKAGDISGACSHLSNAVNCMIKDGMPVDVNALVQEVLRESYVDTTQDLQFYAEKVKYFNEAKKMTREYVQDMRDFKTGLSDHLSANDFCLSDPPSDPEQLKTFNGLVSDYMNLHRTGASGAVHTGDVYHEAVYSPVVSMINELATHEAVSDVLARGDKMINDTFGVGLPSEIKDQISSALASGDDNQITSAMKEVASYVIYLADSAVANGKFGGKAGGIDDVIHTGYSSPCYGDYKNNYLSPKNDSAREDLSCTGGDQAQIIAAFGFDSSVNLSGYNHKYVEVLDIAMSAAHDKWKNNVLIGVEQNTADITKDIRENGPNSEWAAKCPGIVEKVAEAYTEHQFEATGMAKEIGLPGSIPPSDCKTVEDLDNYIQKFEEKLATIGDDSQLANTDLQNVLQRQQQTLQMMSNISKQLSDTALAVIRKIG